MSKDYKVGFGKPPQSTQFQPGTSGNPKGRPKGTRNLRVDLGEELAEKITVTEGGKQLVILSLARHSLQIIPETWFTH